MAQHFAEAGDTHSLYQAEGAANTRSKLFQDSFDAHLGKQIKIIIVEQVDLSLAESTRDKRALIEVREGYWQTQLRTLKRYGGLNKKDERLLHNKRRANPSSQTLTTPEDRSDPNPLEPQPEPSSMNVPNHPNLPQSLEHTVRRSARLKNKMNTGS